MTDIQPKALPIAKQAWKSFAAAMIGRSRCGRRATLQRRRSAASPMQVRGWAVRWCGRFGEAGGVTRQQTMQD